jgi:hypothetical protein
VLAEALQLVIEYDRQPPFDTGSWAKADAATERRAMEVLIAAAGLTRMKVAAKVGRAILRARRPGSLSCRVKHLDVFSRGPRAGGKENRHGGSVARLSHPRGIAGGLTPPTRRLLLSPKRKWGQAALSVVGMAYLR